ncbi:lantibiotic biosynthesis protein [Pseudoalteromonas sp. MSK9-3]|nr:lantibiotic biosynthesis protein [Pseudoalteromonas sp. MSK9-3]
MKMVDISNVSEAKINKITEVIKELTNKIAANCEKEQSNGLLSGLAGQLLFLYNAHRFDPKLVNEDMFSEYLDRLQQGLPDQSFELSNGLAGQAWVLEYFNQANAENYEHDLLDDIDGLFVQALGSLPWNGEIEMVLGLAGYTPYASRRAKFSDQEKLYEVIVDGFERNATELDNEQITWSQPLDSVYRFDKGDDRDNPKESTGAEYNLGLAHGVPGILAALLHAVNIPSLRERVTKLLLGGCDWLLEQQNKSIEPHSACFGCSADGAPESRLGWCYGDLTIALTLARVGKAIDRPSYVDKALEIAVHTTTRDDKSGHIIDAGLCHGSVGLVTIYQMLNNIMPHPALEKATHTWLDYSLAKYDEKGMESFYSYNGLSKSHNEDFSFLMGYAGIGLAYIGFLDDDVSWTDCLLLS